MGLYFQNSTKSTVYIAYGYPNFGCSGINYAKIGWYRIRPGQRQLVWNGYAGGNTFYHYAEDSFRRTWSGPFYTDVGKQFFHSCWLTRCSGLSCRSVGMRRLFVPVFYGDYLVNLVTVGGRNQIKSSRVLNVSPSKGNVRTKMKQLPKPAVRKKRKGKPVTSKRVSLTLNKVKKQ